MEMHHYHFVVLHIMGCKKGVWSRLSMGEDPHVYTCTENTRLRRRSDAAVQRHLQVTDFIFSYLPLHNRLFLDLAQKLENRKQQTTGCERRFCPRKLKKSVVTYRIHLENCDYVAYTQGKVATIFSGSTLINGSLRASLCTLSGLTSLVSACCFPWFGGKILTGTCLLVPSGSSTKRSMVPQRPASLHLYLHRFDQLARQQTLRLTWDGVWYALCGGGAARRR